MKCVFLLVSIVGMLALLAVAAPLAFSQSSQSATTNALQSPQQDWVWGPPKDLMKVFLGDYDNQIVVVEGQFGNQVNNPSWNIFLFGEGDDKILNANLADGMNPNDVPKNVTVRLLGEAKNGEIDVEGVQIQGSTTAQPNATVSGIKAGEFDDMDVALRGQIGDLVDPTWNIYRFTDNSGTIDANFQDEIASGDIIRNRALILYVEVGDDSPQTEVDADMMLVYGSGTVPTNTPTTAPPTDTPTTIPPTSTPTATSPAPTNTPTVPSETVTVTPDLKNKHYLPLILRVYRKSIPTLTVTPSS